MQVVERVRRIFDLAADPFQIASQLSRDPRPRYILTEPWRGYRFNVES
jgi:hypothetical protein